MQGPVNSAPGTKLNRGPHAYQAPAIALEMCSEVPTSLCCTDILLSFAFQSAQIAQFLEHPERTNGHHGPQTCQAEVPHESGDRAPCRRTLRLDRDGRPLRSGQRTCEQRSKTLYSGRHLTVAKVEVRKSRSSTSVACVQPVVRRRAFGALRRAKGVVCLVRRVAAPFTTRGLSPGKEAK